jgi:hypothetical protein
MSPPQSLITRVNGNGPIEQPSVPRPLLTLEEFFEGNDDPGSIGCNLPDAHPREFFDVLRRLWDRPDVADVRVEIRSWDDPEEWPFSDTVWVITSLSPQDIQKHLGKRLHADNVVVGWPDYPVEEVEVPDGMKPLGAWWD